jgi:hypothetical protein
MAFLQDLFEIVVISTFCVTALLWATIIASVIY